MSFKPDIFAGVYLSEAGLGSVRSIFDRYKARDDKSLSKIFDEAHKALFKNRWDSFDNIYRSIYCLNLVRGKPMDRIAASSFEVLQSKNKTSALLNVLLEADFPYVTIEDNFVDTVIDELIIADLFSLRADLMRTLPFDVRLTSLGIGCLWLEFSVYSSNSKTKSPLSKEEIGEIVTSPGWQRIKQRFSLSDENFQLSPVA